MSVFKCFPHHLYPRFAACDRFVDGRSGAGADEDEDADADAVAFAFGLVLGGCSPSTLSISIRLGVGFLWCFLDACDGGSAPSLSLSSDFPLVYPYVLLLPLLVGISSLFFSWVLV